MKIFDKKGVTWQQLVLAILALVVVVLVVVWFTRGGEKAFGEVGKKLDQLGDCDKDNIANLFDKCPCVPVTGEENPDAAGCPKGTVAKECGKDGSPTIEQTCPDESE